MFLTLHIAIEQPQNPNLKEVRANPQVVAPKFTIQENSKENNELSEDDYGTLKTEDFTKFK